MKDLPLEVLRDLWLARFGAEAPWDTANNAAAREPEAKWPDVFVALTQAEHLKTVHSPLRIIVNQEKM